MNYDACIQVWEIEWHPEQNQFFIHKNQVPAGRKATCANAVYYFTPFKYDPYRVRLTVGGDIFIYQGDPSTPVESLLDSKIIFYSTISTPGALFFVQTSKIIL